jgi:hypothetical protein
MAVDGSHAARLDAHGRGIDPLAEQAANLLAKAMVTSRDRDALWARFQSLLLARWRNLKRRRSLRRSRRWNVRGYGWRQSPEW